MALNNRDQERIREYLLGQLNDDEQEKLEKRLMTENDLFEELEISKDEVIQEYCAGELTAKEREWLEQHFLASQDGKLGRKMALAMAQVKTPAPKSFNVLDRVKSFWRSQPWALAAVTSAAVILVVGGTIWLYRPVNPKRVLAIELMSSALNRGDSTRPIKIRLSPNDELTASLILATPATPGETFRAELDDTREIKAVEIARQDAYTVVVTIPASHLPRGRYVLTLYSIPAGGTERQIPGGYYFNIE